LFCGSLIMSVAHAARGGMKHPLRLHYFSCDHLSFVQKIDRIGRGLW
jgi:hypothetical protein